METATNTPTAPTSTKTRHYYKGLVNVPYSVSGARVPFEVLDGNRGLIAIDPDGKQILSGMSNAALIEALDKAANEHRGGIERLTPEGYAQKKSLYPYNPAKAEARRQKDLVRLAPQAPPRQLPKPSPLTAAAAGNPIPNIPGVPLSVLGMQRPAGQVAKPPGPVNVQATPSAAPVTPPPFKPATMRASKLTAKPGDPGKETP